MSRTPRRPRAQRRAQARAEAKLIQRRLKLFALERGGTASRPIEVQTAPSVESQAQSTPCPACGAALELLEHAAVTVDGARLREARMRCRVCHRPVSVWFSLRTALN